MYLEVQLEEVKFGSYREKFYIGVVQENDRDEGIYQDSGNQIALLSSEKQSREDV